MTEEIGRVVGTCYLIEDMERRLDTCHSTFTTLRKRVGNYSILLNPPQTHPTILNSKFSMYQKKKKKKPSGCHLPVWQGNRARQV